MINEVDKDDILLARAANPRTGLITPAATSLLGSARDDYIGTDQALPSSAKWQIEGGQWVSIERNGQLAKTPMEVSQSPRYLRPGRGVISLDKPLPLIEEVIRMTDAPTRAMTDQAGSRTPTTVSRKPSGTPAHPRVPNIDESRLTFVPKLPPRDMRVASAPLELNSTVLIDSRERHLTRSQQDFLVRSTNMRATARLVSNPQSTARPFLQQPFLDGPYPVPRARRTAPLDEQLVPEMYRDREQHLRDRMQCSSEIRAQRSRFDYPPAQRLPLARSLQPQPGAVRTRNKNGQAYYTSAPRGFSSNSLSATTDVYMPSSRGLSNTQASQQGTQNLLHGPVGMLSHAYTMPDLRNVGRLNFLDHPEETPASRPDALRRTAETSVLPTLAKARQPQRVLSSATIVQHSITQDTFSEIDHAISETEGSTSEDPKAKCNVIKRTEIDHAKCCQACCAAYDCHESCLGHSPTSSKCSRKQSSDTTASTDTVMSSDHASVSTLDNSIKSLHEFNARKETKLARFKAFLKPKDDVGPSAYDMIDMPPASLRATLRDSVDEKPKTILARQAAERSESPNLTSNLRGALSAARAVAGTSVASTRSSPPATDVEKRKKKRQVVVNTSDRAKNNITTHQANASKRVRNRYDQREVMSPSQAMTSDEESYTVRDELFAGDTTKRFSFSSAFMSFTPLISDINQFRTTHPNVSESLTLVYKSMLAVLTDLLSTLSVLATLLIDYNRTKQIRLPDGMTSADLLLVLLRCVFYLSVSTGIVALLVKILAFMLAILRVVFLPVRMLTWVVG